MTCFAEKLSSAGYSTHYAGKWDAGIATPDHTPQGRGFSTSLSFAEHMVRARMGAGEGRGNFRD